MAESSGVQEPIAIGSRLELFVDDFLMASIGGEAALQLHRPERRQIVFETDAPWEGNASTFQSGFRDGPICRMYYRGLHYRNCGPPAQAREDHPWYLCYAESDDGIHWRRPELGLFEFAGSRANNIILTPEFLEEIKGCPAHTAAFKDQNPDCPTDERYKIIVVGKKPKGLYLLKSADGIHFSLMSREPAVTQGAFDSQNLAFWDPAHRIYREYHREFRDERRGIMTASSPDILNFPEPKWLTYTGCEEDQLYTNQVQPYYRAPHILMGMPHRYVDRGWSEPVLQLPQLEERLARAASHPRYGTAVTDAVFMTSRDGETFHRWPEAFIRPGPRRTNSWVYGDNFIFWGMVETRADIDDAPNEISLYVTEGYWEGIAVSIRRYALRVDGFVSVNAPRSGGEVLTHPLLFAGGNLALNFETSAAGSIRVELQDLAGRPIEGYRAEDCEPIFGDTLRHIVRWQDRGGDLRALEGQPVRLRFLIRDADLYSLQFVPYEPDPDRPELPTPDWQGTDHP
jgi:hypothetical protein